MRRSATSAATRQAHSPWGWALAGAGLGLLLALVLNAPARWFTAALHQATQGRVQLGDARGTLWQGSAHMTLTGGAGSTDSATLPGRLAWQLWPSWTGLQVQVQANCCMQQAWHMRLRPHWGGATLVLADSLSQWPASWLTGLGTPWNTLQIAGQLTLATQGLSMRWVDGQWRISGRVQVEATDIASRLSTLKPMGSYRITVLGGRSPSLQLETMDGPLQLSGHGQWVGARFRFDGEASAAPQRLDALSNLLNIIGRRDGARSLIKVG